MNTVGKKRNYILLAALLTVILAAGLALLFYRAARKSEIRSSIEMGDRYLSELDYEQAVAAYQAAFNIDPKNTEAGLGLAGAYEAQQMYAYAEAVYLNMLENDDTQASAYEKLADLYLQDGRLEEAKELLERAADKADSERLSLLQGETSPEAPGASCAAGAYRERVRVELLPAGKGDTVYYTLDGTEPDQEASVYEGPIILKNGRTTVKAVTVNALGYRSDTMVLEYDVQIEDVEVAVTEPEIERLIREKLNLPYSEPIHNDDLAQITRLYLVGDSMRSGQDDHAVYLEESRYSVDGSVHTVSGSGLIRTLEDLRQMPFLEELAVEYQPELDISALADCGELKELSLVGDHLDNGALETLRGMKQLTRLNLSWNDISDISALSGLTNLTSLGVWGNDIGSIQAVSGLRRLTYLDFSDNRVTDISAVSGLSELQQLWMYHNQVSDISPLTGLGKLSVLMLRDNPVSNPEAARAIYPHLSRLDVDLLGLGEEAESESR
ncbi:MAG: leucine-rich repeat domain-containing protein [Roseburia sp.]|nr:leucine-rich repeat domain-containing protein [Roseburia sp.]MCM1097051.1 leucine-rich repeat domain-containing protein [Ruminococcus flavefaciens]